MKEENVGCQDIRIKLVKIGDILSAILMHIKILESYWPKLETSCLSSCVACQKIRIILVKT